MSEDEIARLRADARAAALDALSRACVDLARRRAGLGPVGWPSGQPAGG